MLGGSYIYSRNKKTEYSFGASYYYTQMKEDSSSRSTGLGVSLPIDYSPDEQTSVSLTPQYEKTTYADEDYVANSSLAISYGRLMENHYINLYTSYTGYTDLNEDYEYLAGSGISFSLMYAYYFESSDISITLGRGSEDLEDTDDSIGSNVNHSLTLGYGYSFSESYNIASSLDMTQSLYEEDSEDFAREDTTMTFSMTFTFYTAQEWVSYYLKANAMGPK